MIAGWSIVRVALPRIVARSIGPTIIAIAVSWLCAILVPGNAADPVDAVAPWVQLPMLLVVAGTVLATIDAWPLFGRDRAEASLVERAHVGPFGGSGVVAACGTLVSLLALAPVGIVVEWTSGRSPDRQIDAVYPLASDEGTVRLDRQRATMRLDLPRAARVDVIEIRPRMALGPDRAFATTTIRIRDGAGVELGPPQPVDRTGQLVRIAFPARELAAIQIEHDGVGLPLFITPGAASARSTAVHGPRLTAVATACSATLAAALVLAFLLMLRRQVSRAMCAGVGVLVPIAATALDFTPNADAVQAYARDEWPLGPPAIDAGLWSLSVIAAAMLLALVTGRPRDAT